MVKVIKATYRHNCYEEIKAAEAELKTLYYGSIVECSCGKRYIKVDDQRDGPIWQQVVAPKYPYDNS